MKSDQKILLKEAKKYYNEMKFDLAIETLEKITEPDLKNQLLLISNYDQLALVTKDLSQKRDYQTKGICIGKKLFASHPKSLSLLLKIGHLYHHMAIEEPYYNHEAMGFYKRAITSSVRKSDKIESLNCIGNSHQRSGKLKLALKYYIQGYNLSQGKSIAILYNLSFIYLKLGDCNKCLKYSNIYLKLTYRLPPTKMQQMFRNSVLKHVEDAQIHLNSRSH